jgi:hypothetical protein
VAPLFVGLVDDAAVFPPGSAPLADAVPAHQRHRAAWYASMIGPLLLPTSVVTGPGLQALAPTVDGLAVGLIADTGIGRLAEAVAAARDQGLVVGQVEAAVAKRGEDPQPGLAHLLEVAAALPDVDVYAETPLTAGLLSALDTIVAAREAGVRVAAKFRTGGLAAELFPTPVELAAVICACRDRALPFKLTAGLHRAVRHNDPETGLTHHGFVNILAATLAAVEGAEVVTVAERLAATDAISLTEAVRGHRTRVRPLWTAFGSCSVSEPVGDLRAFGLLGPAEAPSGR